MRMISINTNNEIYGRKLVAGKLPVLSVQMVKDWQLSSKFDKS